MSPVYAPIALFVYSRLWHTRQTIEALQRNVLAEESDLTIFSDAAKKKDDLQAVADVREYLCTVSGFKSVTIVEREDNWGLANSIIDGVTRLCRESGRVIVLEDDLVTSPFFLQYMNQALDLYEDVDQVMHISGCRYPAGRIGHENTFFFPVPLCWGWATWQRAWKHFSKDITIMEKFDRKMISRFSFHGSYHYWKQLEMNKSGEISTWFVFWYANIFLRNGVALFPQVSLVNNIGMDGTGENCGTTGEYDVELAGASFVLEKSAPKVSSVAVFKHFLFFSKIYAEGLLRMVIHKLYSICSYFK